VRAKENHLFRDGERTNLLPLHQWLLALLKLGAIGFGGGMAVIALLHDEFVRKRRVVGEDEFAHGVGLGQILGPFSVNVCIFLGCRHFGIAGGLLSAAAFLTPSISLVIALSYLYFHYHFIPTLQAAVAGLGPVVIALILSAGWDITRRAVRTTATLLIALAAAAATVAKLNTIWILLAGGALGYLLSGTSKEQKDIGPQTQTKATVVCYSGFGSLFAGPIALIFVTFLKIGLVFFGGGFVLVPLLHNHLVTQLHWLQPQEFLDGLAISNLTPGPIAVLATFAGFRVGGIGGALIATVALFGPATVLMLVLTKQYVRLREDYRVKRFLSGVNPAVAGLILGAGIVLTPQALVSWRGYLLTALSIGLLLRLRWHPAFVLGVGAICGYLGFCP
jgi:chromate transporter